jgi:hypothetical protein
MAQDGVQWSDLALAVSIPERKNTRQLRIWPCDRVVHSKLGRSVYAKNTVDHGVPTTGFRSVPASSPTPT